MSRVQRVVAIGDVISVPIPMKMKLEASTEGSETHDNGGLDSVSSFEFLLLFLSSYSFNGIH